VIDADLVLIAIGFRGVEDGFSLPLTSRSTFAVDDALATPVGGVFAAGDCVRGADLIVSAIADGREAARHVDVRLRGSSALPYRDRPSPVDLRHA
jgi:glutamate synthase (NADPH) small chain